MMCWQTIGCAVLSLAACSAALADSVRSISHSEWLITPGRVTLKVFIPADELADLVGKTMPLLSTENVATYVQAHVSVAANGVACPAIDQGYDLGRVNALSAAASLYAFEIIFRCNTAAPITLTNSLLHAEHPAHIDYARIGREGEFVSQLFTLTVPSVQVQALGKPSAAPATRYAKTGGLHIFRSYLCVLSLAALTLLLPRRLRFPGAIALLLGYLVAAALGFSRLMPNAAAAAASLGFVLLLSTAMIVRPALHRQRLAIGISVSIWLLLVTASLLSPQPLVAVLLLGLGLLAAGVLRGAALDSVWPCLIPPALFGFLDGLVPAEDFVRLQHLDELAVGSVLAFNVGALAVSLLLLTAMTLCRQWVEQRRLAAAFCRDAATTALAGLGAYWCLSALF